MRRYFRRYIHTAFAGAFLASVAQADILHLKNGSQIEGAVTEKTSEHYKVLTLAGEVTVSADSIVRIEEKPSILDEYNRRRSKVEETGAAHVALANWCKQQELMAAYRGHMRTALRLDPDCVEAREALGYVRHGDKWVTKRWLERQQEESVEEGEEDGASSGEARALTAEEIEAQKLIEAVRVQWTIQIRAILNHKLNSDSERLVKDGRRRILEIEDPLAIEPMARLLSEGKPAARQTLVEALSLFPQDEATANLAMLAIVDSDYGVRGQALSELKERNDSRVVARFRRALLSDNDILIKRASEGLGILEAKAAIPDLIDLLTAERRRYVELTTPVYFEEFQSQFLRPTKIEILNGQKIVYTPNLGAIDASRLLRTAPSNSEYELRQVTVYRTEVLEALKKITGVNYGFDAKAWRRWFEEH